MFLAPLGNPVIQSGGFDILDLMNPAEVVYEIAEKAKNVSNKVSIDDVIKIADFSRKNFIRS